MFNIKDINDRQWAVTGDTLTLFSLISTINVYVYLNLSGIFFIPYLFLYFTYFLFILYSFWIFVLFIYFLSDIFSHERGEKREYRGEKREYLFIPQFNPFKWFNPTLLWLAMSEPFTLLKCDTAYTA